MAGKKIGLILILAVITIFSASFAFAQSGCEACRSLEQSCQNAVDQCISKGDRVCSTYQTSVGGTAECSEDVLAACNPISSFCENYCGVPSFPVRADCDCGGECDFDNDNFISVEQSGNDCNDFNPNINPGATEVNDGIDNNCNRIIDEVCKGITDPVEEEVEFDSQVVPDAHDTNTKYVEWTDISGIDINRVVFDGFVQGGAPGSGSVGISCVKINGNVIAGDCSKDLIKKTDKKECRSGNSIGDTLYGILNLPVSEKDGTNVDVISIKTSDCGKSDNEVKLTVTKLEVPDIPSTCDFDGDGEADASDLDADGDGQKTAIVAKAGSQAGKDCNDFDKKTYFGAQEVCSDYVDNDCDDGKGAFDTEPLTGVNEGCEDENLFSCNFNGFKWVGPPTKLGGGSCCGNNAPEYFSAWIKAVEYIPSACWNINTVNNDAIIGTNLLEGTSWAREVGPKNGVVSPTEAYTSEEFSIEWSGVTERSLAVENVIPGTEYVFSAYVKTLQEEPNPEGTLFNVFVNNQLVKSLNYNDDWDKITYSFTPTTDTVFITVASNDVDYHVITFKNMFLYNKDERTVLHLNSKFYGCEAPSAIMNLKNTMTGEDLIETNYGGENKFNLGSNYCSKAGYWKKKADGKDHVIESLAPFTSDDPEFYQEEWCPENYCHTGFSCVTGEDFQTPGESFNLEGEKFKCVLGEWQTAEQKLDQDGDIGKVCGKSQCYYNDGVEDLCVNDGNFTFDSYCHKGTWTTRTNIISLELLNIVEEANTDDYSLFCGNYEESLNDLQFYVGTLKADASQAVLGKKTDQPTGPVFDCGYGQHQGEGIGCTNNYCVLSYYDPTDDEEKVVFGTSLNYPIEATRTDNPIWYDVNFLTLLDESRNTEGSPPHFNYCDGVISEGSDKFLGCLGKVGFIEGSPHTLWYNAKTNSVIYSEHKVTVGNVEFGENFAAFITSPFSSIFNFIISVFQNRAALQEQDYSFITGASKFNRIYVGRNDERSVRGIIEKVGENEFMLASYRNVGTNVCSIVDKYNNKVASGCTKNINCPLMCTPEIGDDYWSFTVQSTDTTKGAFDIWPELTSKIRLGGDYVGYGKTSLPSSTIEIVGGDYVTALNQFTASAVIEDAIAYSWDFGDGAFIGSEDPNEVAEVEHVYKEEGTFTVAFRVLDKDFTIHEATKTKSISAIPDGAPCIDNNPDYCQGDYCVNGLCSSLPYAVGDGVCDNEEGESILNSADCEGDGICGMQETCQNSPSDCGFCTGSSCISHGECQSGLCENNICAAPSCTTRAGCLTEEQCVLKFSNGDGYTCDAAAGTSVCCSYNGDSGIKTILSLSSTTNKAEIPTLKGVFTDEFDKEAKIKSSTGITCAYTEQDCNAAGYGFCVGSISDTTNGNVGACGTYNINVCCSYGTKGISVCGDGIIEGNEQCEDGNTIDGDGCSRSCRAEYCGDGIVQQSSDVAKVTRIFLWKPDQTAQTGTCRGENCEKLGGNMQLSACANKAWDYYGEDAPPPQPVQMGTKTCRQNSYNEYKLELKKTEECDDGNDINTDDCTNTCQNPSCDDGIQNNGEAAVDCGGQCAACALGQTCTADADCGEGSKCLNNVCVDKLSFEFEVYASGNLVGTQQAAIGFEEGDAHIGAFSYGEQPTLIRSTNQQVEVKFTGPTDQGVPLTATYFGGDKCGIGGGVTCPNSFRISDETLEGCLKAVKDRQGYTSYGLGDSSQSGSCQYEECFFESCRTKTAPIYSFKAAKYTIEVFACIDLNKDNTCDYLQQ